MNLQLFLLGNNVASEPGNLLQCGNVSLVGAMLGGGLIGVTILSVYNKMKERARLEAERRAWDFRQAEHDRTVESLLRQLDRRSRSPSPTSLTPSVQFSQEWDEMVIGIPLSPRGEIELRPETGTRPGAGAGSEVVVRETRL